jgi:polyisoprenoid-binding protein YceI
VTETTTVTPELTLPGDYVIDPAHSRIGFTARHAMVTKVRGSFGEFSGTAHVDDDPSASHTSLTIVAPSFTTGQEQRDGHVKSADFLDVENFPELTFRSTSVEADGAVFRITGDLTIRDTTKSITIDFESTGIARDPFGNIRAGFEGTATINRKDFGISFNAALETGGVLVSEKIGLEFDISAIKTA